MYKFTIFLLGILLIIPSSTSLMCYSCKNDSCHQNESQWNRVPRCGASCRTPNCVGICLKEIYYIGNLKSKLYTESMCVTAELINGKATHNCSTDERTAIVCATCSEDLCNRPDNGASKNLCTVFLMSMLGYLILSYNWNNNCI